MTGGVHAADRPAAPATLEARALRFAYGNRTLFLDWSYRFEPGLTWIRGRNGSGKSSLMGLLAGALEADAGDIAACGVDARQDPEGYRRQLCWLGPQDMPLDFLSPAQLAGFYMTVFPNFEVAAFEEAVDGLSLRRQLHDRIGGLSTGTRRKAWLAAVLASGTPVCLLDEPGNALDAASLDFLHWRLTGWANSGERCVLLADHRHVWESLATAVVDLGG